MKNLCKVLCVIAIIFISTGCSSSDKSKEETNVSNDYNTHTEKIDDDKSKDTKQSAIDFYGTVDEYIRHYKRLENSYVTVTGNWDFECITAFARQEYTPVYLDISDIDVSDINRGALVYVTGLSTVDENGSAKIQASSINYINPQTELYWSSSQLLDLNVITNGPSRNTEYECVLYGVDDRTFNIVGSYVNLYLPHTALEEGKLYRVLITDIEFNTDKKMYHGRTIERILLEG